jgi:hypothetical protein
MSSSVTPIEIESYSNHVLRNMIRCELPSCAVCHTPPSLFTRHQARPRGFYILCDILVQVVLCLVIRWRCPGCKKTFTQQPPFALPCKRYVRETLLNFTGCYLEEETATYRKVVLEEGMPIFHASTSGEGTIDDRSLAHSTPYRWISALGGFKEILRCAQDLILQKNPASTVCRDLAAVNVSAQKYVKAGRESVLKRCRQILHLEAQFRTTFGASIFPFFATRCAWG